MQNGKLYICGTNAHNPKDYVIYVSKTMLLAKIQTNFEETPVKIKSRRNERLISHLVEEISQELYIIEYSGGLQVGVRDFYG